MSSIPLKQIANFDLKQFPATTNIKLMNHLPTNGNIHKRGNKIIIDHPIGIQTNIPKGNGLHPCRNLICIPKMMLKKGNTFGVSTCQIVTSVSVAAVNLVQVVGSLGFLQWYCSLTYLDLHKMLGKKFQTYSPKWWLDGVFTMELQRHLNMATLG